MASELETIAQAYIDAWPYVVVSYAEGKARSFPLQRKEFKEGKVPPFDLPKGSPLSQKSGDNCPCGDTKFHKREFSMSGFLSLFKKTGDRHHCRTCGAVLCSSCRMQGKNGKWQCGGMRDNADRFNNFSEPHFPGSWDPSKP